MKNRSRDPLHPFAPAAARRGAALVLLPAIVLLAASAPVAGTAGVLPPEKDRWIRVETAHFLLFSNASESLTMESGLKLEQLREVLAKIHPKLEVRSPRPTFIHVFKDDASLTRYKPQTDGRNWNVAGYFLGDRDGNYVAINASGRDAALGTIYHEYIHYFLDHNLPGLPPWFNEGIAECYGTFISDSKLAQIGRPEPSHVYWLREQALMPLRELFAITHDSKDYHEGDRQGVFYAESWALVHYLIWDKPERRPQLIRFVDRLLKDEPIEQAFAASFDVSFETLLLELRNFVSGRRYVFSTVSVQDLKFDARVRATPIGRDEALARLGDLLARLTPNRAADAEAHFREALRLNPSNAGAHAGLGGLLAKTGRFDEAVGEFETALSLDAADFMIPYRYGNALLEQAVSVGTDLAPGEGGQESVLDRIRGLLGRAIVLRPDFGEAYARFGSTYLRAGDSPAAGITALEKARSLLPSRPDIVGNLAILYALKGDRERAHALVDQVLARMNDKETLDWVREHLARADERANAAAARASAQASAGQGAREGEPGPPDLPGPVRGPDRVQGISEEAINNQVEEFNRAVVLANKGDYCGALAILERLQKAETMDDIAEAVAKLIAQVRPRAARQPGTKP